MIAPAEARVVGHPALHVRAEGVRLLRVGRNVLDDHVVAPAFQAVEQITVDEVDPIRQLVAPDILPRQRQRLLDRQR